MGQSLNIRLNDGDQEKLREIARKVGAIAPSGGPKGQPSISRLMMMIASGELLVDAGRGTMAHNSDSQTDNEAQLWRHTASGELFVVQLDRGAVVMAAGPLHHSEMADAISGDWDGDPELAEDINGDQDSYSLREGDDAN